MNEKFWNEIKELDTEIEKQEKIINIFLIGYITTFFVSCFLLGLTGLLIFYEFFFT